MADLRVCLAPNEDGFGPSAFAYYLVRGMLDVHRVRGDAGALHIEILNESAQSFNQTLYSGIPEVSLTPLSSYVRLEKRHGEVSVPETLRRFSAYSRERARYITRARTHLDRCSVAVDIGTPYLVRAAAEAGVTAVTLFDHSWARTVRGICSSEALYSSNPRPTDRDRRLAETIARQIQEDEQLTSMVFLFDRYITPPEFHQHWEALACPVTTLGGVLGGGQDTGAARRMLNRMFSTLGQRPAPAARDLVLISPGGTPVWDELLPRIIHEYLAGPLRDYTPVLSLPRAERPLMDAMKGSDRIRWFDFVPGATQQVILPAFALVVTRAGGGIVNDCLATRTPFVCVEQHHWQVQLVERECRAAKLTPELPETSLRLFRRAPVECIDAFVAACGGAAPAPVPCGVEKEVAAWILSIA